jgi:hypothetical protein
LWAAILGALSKTTPGIEPIIGDHGARHTLERVHYPKQILSLERSRACRREHYLTNRGSGSLRGFWRDAVCKRPWWARPVPGLQEAGIDLAFLVPYAGRFRYLLPGLMIESPAEIGADVRAITHLAPL